MDPNTPRPVTSSTTTLAQDNNTYVCGGFIYTGCLEYTQDSTVEGASDEGKETVKEPLSQGTFVKCWLCDSSCHRKQHTQVLYKFKC